MPRPKRSCSFATTPASLSWPKPSRQARSSASCARYATRDRRRARYPRSWLRIARCSSSTRCRWSSCASSLATTSDSSTPRRPRERGRWPEDIRWPEDVRGAAGRRDRPCLGASRPRSSRRDACALRTRFPAPARPALLLGHGARRVRAGRCQRAGARDHLARSSGPIFWRSLSGPGEHHRVAVVLARRILTIGRPVTGVQNLDLEGGRQRGA